MRPLAGFVAALLAVTVLSPARGQVPASVLGPRPPARVIDETGSLSAADRTEIERLARSIHDTTRADMVVVVIPTTAGEPHRRFATDLFNRWRLGDGARNDGLLLFVALADRRSEIILGDGLDSPAKRTASQGIMDRVMVPHFRAGRPARAILEGATACVTDIVGVSPEQPAAADIAAVPAASAGALVEKRPEPILFPEVAQSFAGPAPAPAPTFAEPVPLAEAWVPSPPLVAQPQPVSADPLPGVLLLGGGAATVAAGFAGLRSLFRPRNCPHCGTAMIRLSESEDDSQLVPSERLEEELGSVNYQVWSCPVCPHVQKSRRGAFFTRYARCPRCQSVTKSQTVSTIQAATTANTGVERVNERCLHCGWEKASTRVTPRLPDPSTSTSSSFDSSSGSSFSSSSSSSSGGHSSGGGASGSW